MAYMPISVWNVYQTKQGDPVIILCVDKPGKYPVVGYLQETGLLLSWDEYGRRSGCGTQMDLVLVDQRVKGESSCGN